MKLTIVHLFDPIHDQLNIAYVLDLIQRLHGIFNETSNLIFIINAVFKSLKILFLIRTSYQLYNIILDILIDYSSIIKAAGLLNDELYRACFSVLSHNSLVIVVESVIRDP